MSHGARRIGFTVSAVVHIAVAGMLVLPGSGPVESPSPQPTVLDLAMFAPVIHQVPEREEVASAAEPPPRALPEPKPVAPPRLPEPEPEPEPEPPPEPKRVEPPLAPAKPAVREPPPKPRPQPRLATPAVPRVQSPPVAEQAAVAPPRQLLPAQDIDDIRRAYLAELARAIEARKHYPGPSRRRGEQGRVVVAFGILADGSIVDVELERSSGHRRLDTAALESVRRLGSVRPIPANLARDHWPIKVPIEFRLR